MSKVTHWHFQGKAHGRAPSGSSYLEGRCVTDYKEHIDTFVAALMMEANRTHVNVTSVSAVVLWGEDAAQTRAHMFAYDVSGNCKPVDVTADLDAAIEALAEATKKFDIEQKQVDPAAQGTVNTGPSEGNVLHGVVARVAGNKTNIALLYDNAAEPWKHATSVEIARMCRPIPDQISTGKSPIPREVLEQIADIVLHDNQLDGVLLENVSTVLRRTPSGQVEWFACAYPSDRDPWLWHPQNTGIAEHIFDLADQAGGVEPAPSTGAEDALWAALESQFDSKPAGPKVSSTKMSVAFITFDVHADVMLISLLGGQAAQVWFEGGPIDENQQYYIELARRQSAGGGIVAKDVYENDENGRWLKSEVVSHLLSLVLDSASETQVPDSVSMTVLAMDTGIEFAAFAYEGNASRTIIPHSLDVASLAAMFNENPGLSGVVLKANVEEERMEAVLLYGSDSRRWVENFPSPTSLAQLAWPLPKKAELAIAGLRRYLKTQDLNGSSGARAHLLQEPEDVVYLRDVWFVQPFESWMSTEVYGWVWDGEAALVVGPGDDPHEVAKSLF